MTEKPEKPWTLQDHDHDWQVWEKRDPLLVEASADSVTALDLITEDMSKRYATCSCGTRLTVSN